MSRGAKPNGFSPKKRWKYQLTKDQSNPALKPTKIGLVSTLTLLFGAHRHVALENLALRHQLAVYKRTLTRPKVRKSDRLFWVALSRVWADWRVHENGEGFEPSTN